MRQTILWLLLIIGVLPSCATDRQRTQTEGTAVGAGAGAILGAGLGFLAGGKEGAIRGAAVGGAAGGVAGYATGTEIANKKEEYAKREAFFDDVLKRTRAMNEDLQQVNIRLAQDIRKFQAETIQLMRQYRQDKRRYSAVQAKHQEVEEKLSRGRTILETVKKEVHDRKAVLHFARQNLQSAQEKNQLDMIEPATHQLEDHRDELEQRLREMTSVKEQLRI